MSRSRLWKLAALLAVGSSGCALCDSCNEPPLPCTGPGCNAALNVAPAPFVAVPANGPFTPQAAAPHSTSSSNTPASGTTTPTFAAPPLPDVPADAPSPPPGPVSPEKP